MGELFRTIRLMVAISWRADAVRSVAAVITAAGQMATLPLRAIGLKVLADGAIAGSIDVATRGALIILGLSALNRLMTHASFNVRMRLRENTQLYLDAHVMGLTAGLPGLEHHERPEYLDQVELIRAERGSLANPFNPISWSLASIVQAVSVVTLLAGVHPLLAALPLFAVPSAWLTVRTARWEVDLRERQAERARVQRHFLELLTEPAAAKEIRIYGLVDEALGRRRRLFDEMERERRTLAWRTVKLTSLGWFVFGLGYVLAIGLAAARSAAGEVSIGEVVLVLALGAQINQQVAEMVQNINWFVRTERAVRRLLWFESYSDEQHRELAPSSPARVPDRLVEGVTFEDVSFRYPGSDIDVLGHVDLHIPAGTTVAIVGENGAGKTTLVKLLCRFYEPSSGRIVVDGMDLRDMWVDEWRARMSAGFQDFAKFKLFARETIGLADHRDWDDATLLRALQRAAATDVTAALPQGFDTQLGRDFDQGVELSIGQWQKLALGRAMLRESPLVLVLDEPTASLDANTEHALFERFHGAAKEAARETGAITILVSHRFSTVRMAELILVVAGGRIAEAGPHHELLALGGLYAELYDLQARAYR